MSVEPEMPAVLKDFGRRLIRRGLGRVSVIMGEFDLSLTHLGTLIQLQQARSLSVSQIAQARGLSLQTASHMLNRLVERGFLAREEDPADRRQKRLTLTPVGEEVLDRFDAGRDEALRELFDHAPPDLMKRLEAVLTELMAMDKVKGSR